MAVDADDIRYLRSLIETKSTARMINLAKRDPEARSSTPADEVLFHSPLLERAILLKHRLTRSERDQFVSPRRIATKILIPIDPNDLSCGAHVLMINQKGFGEVLSGALAIDADPARGEHDRSVLAALDELPSLDPFLVREQLSRRGLTVSASYFQISGQDVAAMLAFARQEIEPLIKLCFKDKSNDEIASRLTAKILKSELDATLDPLRTALDMTRDQFREGMFCWKGFLYYKWLHTALADDVVGIEESVAGATPVGPVTRADSESIAQAKAKVIAHIQSAFREAKASLASYDRAFSSLVQMQNPIGFREFLLAAPSMFFDIGEKLGVIQHIAGCWGSRFLSGSASFKQNELKGVLKEFELCFGASRS